MQQALLFFVLEYDDVSVSSLDELSVFAVERVLSVNISLLSFALILMSEGMSLPVSVSVSSADGCGS